MLVYRVSVKAVVTEENEKNTDQVKIKFVDIGIYDVQANDYNAAAEKAYEVAKDNPTYKEITADVEVEVVATNIKLLSKPDEL